MLPLLKDVLNPVNWIKALKNPARLFEVFNSRINYYPGTRFGYTKYKIIKKLYMSFNLFFARKNKHFVKFFFETENNDNECNTNFNLNKNYHISEAQFQSLEKNGIIVLENALTESEHYDISKNFDEFKKALIDKKLYQYKDKSFSNINGLNHRSYYNENSKLDTNFNLKKISDQITKKIYGQIIEPSLTYGYNELKNLPDPPISGDNLWHSDRYLPNLKLLYFPFGTPKGAPFKFALGSHKINSDFLNFYLNNSESVNTNGDIKSPEDEEKLIKEIKVCSVKPNSLVVALTNGFHARSSFEAPGDRSLLFLLYSNFRLSSLISYWKYNRT